MASTIYYFSGSGNSLMLARELAKNIGKASLVSIPDAIGSKINTKQQVIGFVIPVYMWGIPSIVRTFLESFPACPGAYIFAVGNCGSSVGSTFVQMRKLLAQNGNALDAEFKIQMPGNYTPMYGAPGEARQKKFFSKAEDAITRAADIINAGYSVKVPANPFSRMLSFFIYKSAMKHIHEMDERFILEDSCNGCGICAKVCPVSNIKMVKKKPVWQHTCEHCLACLHWCPEEAINFGKITRGRRRYRNPFVKLKEMMR